MRKRSLFAPLGSIFGPIFGLAAQDDIENLQINLRKMHAVQNDLADTMEESKTLMAEVIEVQNERMANVWKTVHTTNRKVNEIIRRHVTWRGQTQRLLSELNHTLSFTHQDLMEKLNTVFRVEALVQDATVYLETMTRWFEALQDLQQNRLNPFMVPPPLLMRELRRINKRLRQRNIGIELIHPPEDLYHYYTAQLATFLSYGQTFYVYIKVATGHPDHVLDIYEADIHNTPLNRQQGDGDDRAPGFTRVDLPRPYLAVTRSRTMYTELGHRQYQACMSSLHFSCTALEVLRDRRAKSCLMSIFMEEYEDARELCDFRYYPGEPEPEIVPLGRALYLVINSREEIIVRCGAERTVTPARWELSSERENTIHIRLAVS